jgi:peptidoglycan/xylan/chitin deacetylase (PgdA/CDA1 family)
VKIPVLSRHAARWLGGRSDRQGAILLYHRVTELESDPWALAVHPRSFAEHLEVLRRHADPLSLQEMTRRAREGTLPRYPVALTFDDGYRDNLLHAKPMLERFDVPATVFVPTAGLDTGREFWWDELEALLLQQGVLPGEIRLEVGGRSFRWELAEAAGYLRSDFERYRGWRAWEDPPAPRQAVFRAVWELLHPLPAVEREQAMEQLRIIAGAQPSRRAMHRILSPDELRELTGGGLLEVGAHTVTHPSLAALPPAEQEREIREGRKRLEQLLGVPVTTFAYPFGKPHDFTDATVEVLRKCGFVCACTNVPGTVQRSTDAYRLPRIYITDTDGDGFARLLEKWLPLRGMPKAGAP